MKRTSSVRTWTCHVTNVGMSMHSMPFGRTRISLSMSGTQSMSKKEKIITANKRPIKIGIDGGSNTGVAIKADGNLSLHTMDFWSVFEYLTEEHNPREVAIFIEDPKKNKPLFSKLSGRPRDKMAMNVGGVKRESTLLIEGLERAGFLVIPIRPKHSKWSHKRFCQITGWPEKDRTNEHQRDAARLIIAR